MLEKEVTDMEVLQSLKNCNLLASPGPDGVSYLVYLECWQTLGKPLCKVVREVLSTGSLSQSMAHSFQVYCPKQGKAGSILPREKRKIALLQADYKVLSGVLAGRLKKTVDHTLSPHQYAVGSKRITHAVSQARDLIFNTPAQHKGVAIVETDMVAAYDFCALSWTWKALRKKMCSENFVSLLEKIFELHPSYVVNIINNEQQKRMRNKRGSIKQGCKLASLFYCYSIDGLLTRLHNRLQGHVYHKLPASGPCHPKLGPPVPAESRAKVFG